MRHQRQGEAAFPGRIHYKRQAHRSWALQLANLLGMGQPHLPSTPTAIRFPEVESSGIISGNTLEAVDSSKVSRLVLLGTDKEALTKLSTAAACLVAGRGGGGGRGGVESGCGPEMCLMRDQRCQHVRVSRVRLLLSEGPSIKAKLVPTAKYLLRTVQESFLYAEHCARHLPATSSHLILRTNFRLRWYHDYPLYVLRNRGLTTLTYLITPRADLIASDVELGFELRKTPEVIHCA